MSPARVTSFLALLTAPAECERKGKEPEHVRDKGRPLNDANPSAEDMRRSRRLYLPDFHEDNRRGNDHARRQSPPSERLPPRVVAEAAKEHKTANRRE